ncbi:septum formation initiator family protein [Patescibacteria group bacterium]|nr:septum formation initiator family protein [Patescibacteria group bacterium]
MITSLKRFKKRKEVSFFWLFFLFFLAFALVMFILNLNFKISKENAKAENELNSLKKEVQKLELEKKNFLIKISEIKTKEYLERVGREDFDLKKQGENVVSFPATEKEQGKKTPQKEEKENLWGKFLKKIGIR